MKRVIVFILTFVMAFSLTACCAFIKPEKIIERIKPVHTHEFLNYVCSECGAVDTSHAYEYLIEWMKENGDHIDGTYICEFEESNYTSAQLYIMYSTEHKNAYLWLVDDTRSAEVYHAIYLDDYFYGFTIGDDNVYGYIPADTYTKDTALSYDGSECVVLEPSDYLPVIQSSTNVLLNCFSSFLLEEELGITLADLGFTSYESESTQP